MSPTWRTLGLPRPFSSACRGDCRGVRKEDNEVKNLKKAMAVTMVAGGLMAAGAGMASATDIDVTGVASPSIASGNTVQAPVHAPVNVSGNSVTVIGAMNPAFGNTGVNN